MILWELILRELVMKTIKKVIRLIVFTLLCFFPYEMQAYKLIEEEYIPEHILNQRKLVIQQITAELKSKYRIRIAWVVCFLAPLGKEITFEFVNQLLDEFSAYSRNWLRNYLHGTCYYVFSLRLQLRLKSKSTDLHPQPV